MCWFDDDGGDDDDDEEAEPVVGTGVELGLETDTRSVEGPVVVVVVVVIVE